MDLAIENISDFLIDGEWKTRPDVLAMLKNEGIGGTNGDSALKQMVADGTLRKRPYGKNGSEYAWGGKSIRQQGA